MQMNEKIAFSVCLVVKTVRNQLSETHWQTFFQFLLYKTLNVYCGFVFKKPLSENDILVHVIQHNINLVSGVMLELISSTLIINPGRHGGGGVVNLTPLDFLALNFCSLTDYQKLWHNCSLLIVIISFDPNSVTSRLTTSS